MFYTEFKCFLISLFTKKDDLFWVYLIEKLTFWNCRPLNQQVDMHHTFLKVSSKPVTFTKVMLTLVLKFLQFWIYCKTVKHVLRLGKRRANLCNRLMFYFINYIIKTIYAMVILKKKQGEKENKWILLLNITAWNILVHEIGARGKNLGCMRCAGFHRYKSE